MGQSVRADIVTFAEGDVTVQEADTPEEFRSAIQGIRTWNEVQGHKFHGIDGMLNAKLIARFKEIGLGELLH